MPRTIKLPLWKRLLHEKRVQNGVEAIALTGAILTAIYMSRSDRIVQSVQPETRIEANGKTTNLEGISINGIHLPYVPFTGAQLHLKPEDFKSPTNHYNIQFTPFAHTPIDELILTFQIHGKKKAVEYEVRGMAPSETKEVTFGGDMQLEQITVMEKGGGHDIIYFAGGSDAKN